MPAPFCTLRLKVIPNATRDALAGRTGEAFKVKVRAPALNGRANAALLVFLARRLGVSRSAVTLVRGEKSPHKVVHIAGLDDAEAGRRLTEG